MRNIATIQKIFKHRYLVQLFFLKNRAIYKIIWKSMVEPERAHMTIWCMPFARWIPKATNALSEYVILIDFLLQQWFRGKYPSLLR
jgi:hypothetical protein